MPASALGAMGLDRKGGQRDTIPPFAETVHLVPASKKSSNGRRRQTGDHS